MSINEVFTGATLRFSEFSFKHFRGMGDLSIKLDTSSASQPLCLLGINESGKTTILQAIEFAGKICRGENIGLREWSSLLPRHVGTEFSEKTVVRATLACTDDSGQLVGHVELSCKVKFVGGQLSGEGLDDWLEYQAYFKPQDGAIPQALSDSQLELVRTKIPNIIFYEDFTEREFISKIKLRLVAEGGQSRAMDLLPSADASEADNVPAASATNTTSPLQFLDEEDWDLVENIGVIERSNMQLLQRLRDKKIIDAMLKSEIPKERSDIDIDESPELLAGNPLLAWGERKKVLIQEREKYEILNYINQRRKELEEILGEIKLPAEALTPYGNTVRDALASKNAKLGLTQENSMWLKILGEGCVMSATDSLAAADSPVDFLIAKIQSFLTAEGKDETFGVPSKRALAELTKKINNKLNAAVTSDWRRLRMFDEEDGAGEIGLQSSLLLEVDQVHKDPDGVWEGVDFLLSMNLDETQNRMLGLKEMSKGFKWFLNFVLSTEFRKQSLEKDRPCLFLIDEPATNIHAEKQQVIVDKLADLASDHCSVVYTTHSPFMLSEKFDIGFVCKSQHNIQLAPYHDFFRELNAGLDTDSPRLGEPQLYLLLSHGLINGLLRGPSSAAPASSATRAHKGAASDPVAGILDILIAHGATFPFVSELRKYLGVLRGKITPQRASKEAFQSSAPQAGSTTPAATAAQPPVDDVDDADERDD